MFRPVGKPRVAEEIVHQLRGLILRGAYTPGDKLPPERKLAEELGVNRASLREAIKTLEHMGLVKTRQGDGTRVLDFMQTAGVELVSHLIARDGAPNVPVLLDVLDFRRWFSRETARLAAARATADDLKALEALAQKAADPALELGEILKIDFEFYVQLTYASKNQVMQLLINTIRAAVSNYAPFFAQFYPPAATVRKHHKDLLRALGQKDEEGASKIVDAFMKKATDQLATLARA
jgi:GntR family transcriptional repressor for pyruvate dehydrogenase complex